MGEKRVTFNTPLKELQTSPPESTPKHPAACWAISRAKPQESGGRPPHHLNCMSSCMLHEYILTRSSASQSQGSASPTKWTLLGGTRGASVESVPEVLMQLHALIRGYFPYQNGYARS